MGQRSEIYVAVEQPDGKKKMTARYFTWNYAERMISRVAYTSKWVRTRVKDGCAVPKEDLVSIMETNFDMVDIVRSERIESHAYNFCKLHLPLDNGLNDGRAFIFISKDGDIKYCFTENHSLKPLDCNGYMLFDTESCYPEYQWKNRDYKYSDKMKRCRRNIKWLKENAKVMTQEELDNYIKSTYVV